MTEKLTLAEFYTAWAWVAVSGLLIYSFTLVAIDTYRRSRRKRR